MPLRGLKRCPGECGRSLLPHRIACIYCWTRVPVEMRLYPDAAAAWLQGNPSAEGK